MAVTRHVQIIFSVNGQAAAGQIRQVGFSLRDLTGTIWRVNYLLQGLGRIARQFVDVNQMFENLNLSFAGVMHSAGLTRSWSEARRQAAGFVEEIRNQAALLPGTMQEYVEIASRAYPALARAGFTTVAEQARFIGKYGSISKAMMIGAPQAGRDLFLMLTGASRATTRMWLEFKEYLRGMGISQEKWKQMTAPERAQALLAVFEKFKPMVDDFAQTWDTIWGTFTTHLQQIKQIGTGRVFDGLKALFGDINRKLEESKAYYGDLLDRSIQVAGIAVGLLGAGKLFNKLAATSAISGFVSNLGVPGVLGGTVPVGKGAALAGAGMLAMGGVNAYTLAKSLLAGDVLTALVSAAALIVQILMLKKGLGIPAFAAGLRGALGVGALGAIGLLLAGGAHSMITNRKNVGQTTTWGLETFGASVGGFGFNKWFGNERVNEYFDLLFHSALPIAVGLLTEAAVELLRLVQYGLNLIPGVHVEGLTNRSFIAPENLERWQLALRGVGLANAPGLWTDPGGRKTAGKFFATLPGQEQMLAVDQLARARAEYKQTKLHLKTDLSYQEYMDLLAEAAPRKARALGKLLTPDGRTSLNQDFRYSRFDIRQMFAEGFDPDRIAVGFAESIGKIGAMRGASHAGSH